MNWFAVVLHWTHVVLAVIWLGGHVVRVLLVEPALRRVPESARPELQAFVDRRATQIFVPVIVGVSITGLLRGTVAGPINSVETLIGTPYGLTFAAAVLLGVVAFYPRKPEWLLWVSLLGAFTAMILMHFGV